MILKGKIKKQEVRATIIKADGTVIPLGVIAEYHMPWYERVIHYIWSKING